MRGVRRARGPGRVVPGLRRRPVRRPRPHLGGVEMNAATRELMFSSARQDWTTPRDFYAELDAEFHFELDAAASDENHLAPCYYTEDSGGGGLDRKWYVSTFCNPRYGRGVTGRWVEKASREVREGRCPVAVLLLPSRTDTAWWHEIGRAHV